MTKTLQIDQTKVFLKLLDVNVDNDKLTYASFRQMIRNSLPLCFEQTSSTERRLHESQRDSSSYPG